MARSKAAPGDLAELLADPAQRESERGRAALREALASRDAGRVEQAAKLVRTHGLRGVEDALVSAYRALVGRSQADPSCLAKEAVLAALDAAEHDDALLFVEAAQHTQQERGKPGARDTAGRVRVRGVLGLARLGHADALAIFGARLADPDPEVRAATAQAIAHRGQRDGAGLLLLKLGVGDDHPNISLECLRGLFALAPDLAVPEARRLLRVADERVRESILHALGAAGDDRALEVLQDELGLHSLAQQRAPIIEALGLSVRPRARAILLELVADGSESDAGAALRALSIHRYDPKLVAQLREAVAQHGGASLQALCERELGR
jgi:HEAT repeat protein